MHIELELEREGERTPLPFEVRRMINAGFTGRDTAAVQAHIDELAAEGVEAPPAVPVYYPVVSHNLTTSDRIDVAGARTSGEAEAVLFLDNTGIYVGVGSDHTDRALETYGILESKQVCANVCSSAVWALEDVDDRWDDLILRSWTTPEKGDGEVVYQEGPMGLLLPPEDLIHRVVSAPGVGGREGLVIFGGTVPLRSGKTIYGSSFRCELEDPATGRRLTCGYTVEVLQDPNVVGTPGATGPGD